MSNYTADRVAWAIAQKFPDLKPKKWEKHGLERIYLSGGWIEIKNLDIVPLGRTISQKQCPVSLEVLESVIRSADYAEFEVSKPRSSDRPKSRQKYSREEWCFGAADDESF